MKGIINKVVGARAAVREYPALPPFRPPSRYPESIHPDINIGTNAVYQAVRTCLVSAGLDRDRLDTAAWNPLGEFIMPGDTVLLKPNLVKKFHPRDPDGWSYVLTHGSVIRAVADYSFIALGGRGKVVIADAPQTDSSFRKIATLLGLYELQEYYRQIGLDLGIIDLRKEEWVARDEVIVERRLLNGDPEGSDVQEMEETSFSPSNYVGFDLGAKSEFGGHAEEGR